MTRIRMIWVLPMLLLALSIVAIWLSHTKGPDGYVADTSRNEIELWFGDSGQVLLDGQLIKQSNWKELWSRVLEKSRKMPVRIGADENVPYALVHEAYAESWQRGFHDVGYALDPQGHFVALSELTRRDATPKAGEPIVLEMNAQGQMAWQGMIIDERQLCGMVRVVAANFQRDPYLALIGLKIDPQAPYGLVRRMLSTISKAPPYRVATFEEREIRFHTWFPLPQIPPPIGRGDPPQPMIIYRHMTPENLITAYRGAYAKSGMVQFRRHIIYAQRYADSTQEVREEIRFSKSSSGRDREYASFQLDAYTKGGMCRDCAVTREGYSFHSYEQDWRAIRTIRQRLGQSLAPACDTECPASVEDWIDGKSDKTPAPDIHQYPPGHRPAVAMHQ